METNTSTRLPVIDFLRGIALFGILVVNIWVFSTSFIAYEEWTTHFSPTVDPLLMRVSAFAFEQRFVGIFSLLFGLSIAIQQQRYAGKQVSFGRYYFKRSIVFIGLGILNILLFFWGDILLIYGVLSLLLYPLLKLSNKTLLWIAAGVFLVPLGLFLSGPFKMMMHEYEEGIRNYYTPESLTLTYQSGSFTEMMIARIREYISYNALNIQWQRTAFAIMLVGYVIGRSQLYLTYTQYATPIKWILAGCIIYTLAFGGYFFIGKQTLLPWEVFFSLYTLFIPVSICLYIALLLWAFQFKPLQLITKYISDLGRLSLSNYFFQSIAGSFLFTHAGLCWYFHTTPSTNFLIALSIFGLQLLLTHLYLKKFTTGPMEILIRKLTSR
ncbi:MAG: DUF418 domain-containing protein [Bacteroidota bacterium]